MIFDGAPEWTRQNLSTKTHAIYEWAVQNSDFTHLFLVNDTTFVAPERLANSGFEKYDWVGHCLQQPNKVWIDDSAMWLSRRAVEIVVADGRLKIPRPDADVATAEILLANKIQPTHDPRYGWRRDFCLDPLPYNNMITNRAHTPEAQRFLWQEYTTPR